MGPMGFAGFRREQARDQARSRCRIGVLHFHHGSHPGAICLLYNAVTRSLRRMERSESAALTSTPGTPLLYHPSGVWHGRGTGLPDPGVRDAFQSLSGSGIRSPTSWRGFLVADLLVFLAPVAGEPYSGGECGKHRLCRGHDRNFDVRFSAKDPYAALRLLVLPSACNPHAFHGEGFSLESLRLPVARVFPIPLSCEVAFRCGFGCGHAGGMGNSTPSAGCS